MDGTQPGLAVLFEDDQILAVDKPAGVHSAPLRMGESGTLLGLVFARYPEVTGLPGIKAVEPGLLHRLDRETSGILLVARTAEAFNALREEFMAGRVKKQYTALCACRIEAWAGERLRLESRFAPYGRGRMRVRVLIPGEEGRYAARKAAPGLYRTEIEVLERQGSWALVQASLLRGFRHQVRAHLAHLGLPIAGDELYGVEAPRGAPERLYLHASALELRHPASGQALRLSSPLPPEFRLPGGGTVR
jgi:23S rRNA pseudouridine1911/1915/1917 synthase